MKLIQSMFNYISKKKKIRICSNRALSLSCKVIWKVWKIRQPILLSFILDTLKVKQASASDNPVINQGFKGKFNIKLLEE